MPLNERPLRLIEAGGVAQTVDKPQISAKPHFKHFSGGMYVGKITFCFASVHPFRACAQGDSRVLNFYEGIVSVSSSSGAGTELVSGSSAVSSVSSLSGAPGIGISTTADFIQLTHRG